MRAVLRIRKEPYYRRAAFESGLQKVGFKLADKITPADASDWLILWNRQGPGEIEADAWEAKGGTVIVCENGYLQKVDKTHYAISVHGHNGSGWFPQGSEDRFSKLGFELKPWRLKGLYNLICGQRGIGSREMKSPLGWAEKLDAKLRKQGLPTRLRQHPGNFAPRVPLILDLEDAMRCWVWSSAAGVQALVEGVDVSFAAPHWVCSGRGIALYSVDEAADDYRPRVLNHMAHGQWHHEEIATGEPFARIIAEREKASW